MDAGGLQDICTLLEQYNLPIQCWIAIDPRQRIVCSLSIYNEAIYSGIDDSEVIAAGFME